MSDRLSQLEDARKRLVALLPTVETAGESTKRMIATPDTPYGTALLSLIAPIDEASLIIRGIYPDDTPDFPRALGLSGINPVGPVSGEDETNDEGRKLAIRNAQGCVIKITQEINRFVEKILSEENAIEGQST